jgi:hypothetical protein
MLMKIKSYATKINERYSNSASHVVTLRERWTMTYNSATPRQQQQIDNMLSAAKFEFRRRNPLIKTWADLDLAEAKQVLMSSVRIDGSMQRKLDIDWVIELLTKFCSTMVVPIQVYRPSNDNDEFLAWDGQHTLMLLWVIATQIMELSEDAVEIPVNIYKSNQKSQMRANFISLNSKEGKKMLEQIDIFMQKIFGVRIDHSSNPEWIEAEKKQQHVETHDLFLTSEKFGDDEQPGAISRLQEINKLSPDSVGWLSQYLSLVSGGKRPAGEKEMVMMGQFFYRCKAANIKVDHAYITELANVAKQLWDADFDPHGKFWVRAANAYYNWHHNAGLIGDARFSKEPPHGMPFLLAQLRKSFGRPVPSNISNSEFVPAVKDLF